MCVNRGARLNGTMGTHIKSVISVLTTVSSKYMSSTKHTAYTYTPTHTLSVCKKYPPYYFPTVLWKCRKTFRPCGHARVFLLLKENVNEAVPHFYIYGTNTVVYFLKSMLPNIVSNTQEISISSWDFKYTTFRENFAHLTFSSSVQNNCTE